MKQTGRRPKCGREQSRRLIHPLPISLSNKDQVAPKPIIKNKQPGRLRCPNVRVESPSPSSVHLSSSASDESDEHDKGSSHYIQNDNIISIMALGLGEINLHSHWHKESQWSPKLKAYGLSPFKNSNKKICVGPGNNATRTWWRRKFLLLRHSQHV